MPQRPFSVNDAALTINYISFVYRTLIAQGYAAEPLLADTGLTAERLSDPTYRCTFLQHKRFVLNALAVTQDEHLGVRMATRFNAINIGLPASAAISSDTFGVALDVMQRFIALNFSILSFEYQMQEDDLVITWYPAVDVEEIAYFVLGSTLVLTEKVWKLLLGEVAATRFAELQIPKPVGWQEVADSLAFDVKFGASSNRSVLPAGLFSQHLSGSDPVMHSEMLRLCEKQASETYVAEGLDAQLRKLLVRKRYQSLPIEEAAAELGLSARSLRRQLEQSGKTYKTIVDEMRINRAKELLTASQLPVTSIAYELGFSDPSNFARTFKRWAGVTPQSFRNGQE